MNVIVENADEPTAREKLMLQIHANGYREMGNVSEGTEFKEYAAQNLTGVVREERAGVLKKLRGVFGMAA